jgi:hypothetical protein
MAGLAITHKRHRWEPLKSTGRTSIFAHMRRLPKHAQRVDIRFDDRSDNVVMS